MLTDSRSVMQEQQGPIAGQTHWRLWDHGGAEERERNFDKTVQRCGGGEEARSSCEAVAQRAPRAGKTAGETEGSLGERKEGVARSAGRRRKQRGKAEETQETKVTVS